MQAKVWDDKGVEINNTIVMVQEDGRCLALSGGYWSHYKLLPEKSEKETEIENKITKIEAELVEVRKELKEL